MVLTTMKAKAPTNKNVFMELSVLIIPAIFKAVAENEKKTHGTSSSKNLRLSTLSNINPPLLQYLRGHSPPVTVIYDKQFVPLQTAQVIN